MPKELFDDEEYSLDVAGDPPKELLEYAKERWNETDITRPAKLEELRNLITSKDEIEPHRTDDAFLIRFLRARNFKVERAYDLLVNYTNFKEDNPEIHENIHPPDLYVISEDDIVQVLPFREQTGRRVMIYKLGNWKPSERPVLDLFRGTLLLLELGILEQRAQILGGIAIFDLRDISLSHAWQTTPSVATKVIQLMVTCFPLKVHALHIIFESWVFDIMFNMFKPFLNDKMKEKLFFHGNDVESLHQHIDPKYLPKRYGGLRSNKVRYKKWLEGFRNNKFILDELLDLGCVFEDKDLDTPIVDSGTESTDEEEDYDDTEE